MIYLIKETKLLSNNKFQHDHRSSPPLFRQSEKLKKK